MGQINSLGVLGVLAKVGRSLVKKTFTVHLALGVLTLGGLGWAKCPTRPLLCRLPPSFISSFFFFFFVYLYRNCLIPVPPGSGALEPSGP